MVTGADIHLADGRTLHAYETRPDRSGTSATPRSRPSASLNSWTG
jgi:hypothetical protein